MSEHLSWKPSMKQTTILAGPSLKTKYIPFEVILQSVLLGYFILLCLSAFELIPHFDSFYYWDWSRHLAASYFDGPPLIAFLLRGVCAIFGNHLYVLNLFTVCVTTLTAGLIFATSRLIMSKRASLIASAVWYLCPLTYQGLIRITSYNNPLSFFWVLSLFFAIRYLLNGKNKDLYFLGLAIGWLILSKYSAVILIIGFFLFICLNKEQRSLWKNPHLYASLLIIIACSLPIIIWNMQHNWVSILYQFNSHKSTSHPMLTTDFKSVSRYLISSLLPAYNLLLVVFIIGLYKWRKQNNTNHATISLLNTISLTIMLFYLLLAWHIHVKTMWLTPGLISLSMLFSYYCELFSWKKTVVWLIALYSLAAAVLVLANTKYALRTSVEKPRYHLIQQLSHYIQPSNHMIWLTAGWMSARMAFLLPGKPLIYTVPSCQSENQYHAWSQTILNKIKQHKINNVMFVDYSLSSLSCIKRYFNHCDPLPTISYTQRKLNNKTQLYNLYAFHCYNA